MAGILAPMPARITLADLATWRAELAEEGDGEHLDPTLAQQIAPRLMAEVEALQAELARARADAFAEAAVHLAQRLSTVRTYGGACAACRDGEANAMTAWLRRAAGVLKQR